MTVFEEAVNAAKVYFGDPEITLKTVRRKRKMKRVVMVRNWVMAYMRARDSKRFSFPVIARILGFSDHATVMNGVKNAHAQFGEVLFRRITLDRLQSVYTPIRPPQAVHIAPKYDDMIRRGLELLRAETETAWVNGKGWGVAA